MQILDGLIFGFVDNFLLIIGTYVGVNLELRFHRFTHQYNPIKKFRSFLKQNSRGVFGGLIGAALSHVLSNTTGAILDPSMRHMVLGIALGTLIPVFFIPIIEIIKQQKNISRTKS